MSKPVSPFIVHVAGLAPAQGLVLSRGQLERAAELLYWLEVGRGLHQPEWRELAGDRQNDYRWRVERILHTAFEQDPVEPPAWAAELGRGDTPSAIATARALGVELADPPQGWADPELTEDLIRAVARKYCTLAGLDPDEDMNQAAYPGFKRPADTVPSINEDGTATLKLAPRPRWQEWSQAARHAITMHRAMRDIGAI